MKRRKTTDTVQINVRMREGLREKLEQSAKKNYESLNREIVDRLERSFDRQDLLIEALTLAYGEQVAGRLMMVGRAMEQAGRLGVFAISPRKSGDTWTDDPFAYHQALEAVTMVLWEFRPEGDPTPPQDSPLFQNLKPKLIGASTATQIVSAVKGKAPPDMRKWASTVRNLIAREEEE